MYLNIHLCNDYVTCIFCLMSHVYIHCFTKPLLLKNSCHLKLSKCGFYTANLGVQTNFTVIASRCTTIQNRVTNVHDIHVHVYLPLISKIPQRFNCDKVCLFPR